MWLDAHLSGFEVLAVDDEAAVVCAAVRVELRRAGRPIPANDDWIAALARQYRLPVLSRDQHFDAVSGVEKRGW